MGVPERMGIYEIWGFISNIVRRKSWAAVCFWKILTRKHPARMQLRLCPKTEFLFCDSLLVRIHFIIELVWRDGLAPWEFELPLQGSLISTFLVGPESTWYWLHTMYTLPPKPARNLSYRGTSLIRKRPP